MEDQDQDSGLTPKQLKAKLKREAAKVQKEADKAEKKKEADRKKEAKAVTRKVVQLSGKLNVPLTNAVHKAREILQKADTLGLEEDEAAKSYRAEVEKVDGWKKQTSAALTFYSKNPNAELAQLDFSSDKEVLNYLKDLQKQGNDLKTAVLNPAQKKAKK